MKAGRPFTPHIIIGSTLFRFFSLIGETSFRMKWVAFSRLLTSLFIILLFTPFRIIEAIAYGLAKKEEVKAPIFIIGHPRSGTTYFHDSMNEFESLVAPRMIDCLFPFLSKYFEFLLVPILKNVLPETRLMDKMKVNWNSPQEEEFGMALMARHSSVSFLFMPSKSKDILKRYVLMRESTYTAKWLSTHYAFARKIQSMNKGKTLVFKSPGNTARTAELLSIYPDARFIHIVRDPQDVIPSTLNLYNKILPEFSLESFDNFDVHSFVFEYYELVMQKFLAEKSNLTSEQLAELKYEDFVKQPIQELSKIVEQLKIDVKPDDLSSFFEARKSFKRNSFNPENDLVSEINTKCIQIREAYDY